MIDLSRIKAVGLDLDGTLYKTTEETEALEIRAVADMIVKLNPSFTIESAHQYYLENYPVIQSKGGVIAKASGKNSADITDEWIINARVHESLSPDPCLASLLEKI